MKSLMQKLTEGYISQSPAFVSLKQQVDENEKVIERQNSVIASLLESLEGLNLIVQKHDEIIFDLLEAFAPSNSFDLNGLGMPETKVDKSKLN